MPKPAAPSGAGTDAGRPPRRRQARGERRAQQLLDAAGAVFARAGYANASTNAIAREAGVSPGTLYQFFPNKEAMAVELGRRYNHELQVAHREVFTLANAARPLAELLDVALDPMIEFCLQKPGFSELVQSADVPGTVTEEHEAVDITYSNAVQGMIALRAPGLADEDAARIAAMALGIFKSALTLILAAEPPAQEAYIAELKRALYGYLAPVVGTGAIPQP